MRIHPAAIPALLILLVTIAAGADETSRPTSAEIRRRIDDLFTASRYDSILSLIPAYIQRAEAEHDSILLGRMYAQRGRVLIMVGRRVEAERDIDIAIRVAEAARDTIGWMPAIHYKGFVYTGEVRYDDATRCFEQRLLLARKVHSTIDEAWARSAIAYCAHLVNNNARASAEYRQAIALFRQSGSPRLTVEPLIGLGRVEYAVGSEAEAKRCFQQAWVVAREVGDHVNEMWAVNNLGTLESANGDPGRAAAYFQRAFDIARGINFPRGMVIPALNLAARAQELGDFARAQAILSDAKDVCRTRGGGEFSNMVDVGLADLRIAEGRYNAAGTIYRRLLAVTDRLEPQHRDLAVVGLARVLANNDSVPQAIQLLTNNFEASGANVYAEAEPAAYLLLSRLHERANHPEAALRSAHRAVKCAQDMASHRVVVTAHLRESVCYRALGRRPEAYASLVDGLDSLETARRGINTPEWRETFGQDTARDVLDAGQVLLEYPEGLPTPVGERAFFDCMQRFKTRSLLDRISEPRTEAEPAAGQRVATIDELQGHVLRPGELLLEFFVGSAESYLVAVTPDSLRLVKLPGPDSPLAESIDLYHRAVASADLILQSDFPPERLAPIQQSIGMAMMGEVADLVENAQCVFVAPDGFFASIPFGTLMLGDSSRMLMETKDVVQIPSASVLALQRSRPTRSRGGAARLVAFEAVGQSKLPGADEEVRALSNQYAGVQRVRGLVGGAEGLATVLAQCDVLHVAAHALIVDQSPWESGLRLVAVAEAGDSGIAAIPTTTRSSADTTAILSSADSALVARAFRGDPFVRAWQIAKLSLPMTLTVLAGCETAGGRLTTGEGVLGLTAAFMSAGVPVVVSSLWPIDDRATARVMRRFYEHLAKGESVATSLRLAQLDTRRTHGRSHPFYWAGFTVVGDGSMVVRVERASRLRPALLALLALALAGTTMAVVRGRRPRRGADNLLTGQDRV
jgi:CHAT domain-containing protein/tetratricopeptide (TPR) repeat protein